MHCSQSIYVALVGHDESFFRSLGRSLRADHLQTISYRSAEHFLADTKSPNFDCLVIDLELEGMSGLDLSERLSAVRNLTPIVLLTAQDAPELRARAKAASCAGCFRKTDSGADILVAVRRAVGLENAGSGPEK